MSTHSDYAVIATGGKQHRVKVGKKYRFEKIEGELGNSIEFDKVLLLVEGESKQLGAPYLSGAKVVAKIVQHGRGKKVKIFKMRRRKGYRRTQGHRQSFTEVEITSLH